MLCLAFKDRLPCEYMTDDNTQTFVQSESLR